MSLKVCRGCLASTGKLERISDLSRRVYFTICGLTVSPDDGYPQYLCVECSHHMRKALAFRRKVRRAHFVLKEINSKKKEITPYDLKQVDRKMSNLVSPWNYWQPLSSAIYTINLPPEEQTENLDPEVLAAVQDSLLTSNVDPKYDIKTSTKEGVNCIHIVVKDKDTTDDKTIAKDELKRDTPDINSKSTILVDIKPANYKEIERIEEERRMDQRRREEDEALRQIREEDDHFADNDDKNDDYVDPATIDLNDVFKDLQEKETVESDDGLSEMDIDIFNPKKRKNDTNEPSPVAAKKYDHAPKKRYLTADSLYTDEITSTIKNEILLATLEEAKFRRMSPAEQVQGFLKRKEQPEYKSAMYRCAMCVATFNTESGLMMHLGLRHKFKAVKCNICQGGFKDYLLLEIHQSWEHWYEYTCGCSKVWYSLKDLLECCRRHPYTDQVPNETGLRDRAKRHDEWLKKNFTKVLLSPQQWKTTMSSVDNAQICVDCGMDFEYPWTLKQHRNLHTDACSQKKHPSPHTCAVCDTHFRSREALVTHFENIHAYTYKCHACDTSFDRKQALLHFCKKTVTLSLDAHHCVNCGQFYARRAQLFLHQLKNYHLIKPVAFPENLDYTCVECNVQFTNQEAMDTHDLRVHKETRDGYECTNCKRVYKSRYWRNAHVCIANKSISAAYPVQCLHCPEMLSSDKWRKTHMRQRHPGAMDEELRSEGVVCECCGALIAKTTYYIHRTKCAAKVLRCPLCQSTFYKAGECLRHMMRNHLIRPYCCSVCGMRFMDRNDVKTHILKIHAPEKLFECDVCRVRFSCLEYKDLHKKKVHGIVPDKKEQQKRLRQMISISRTNVIVYPHMKMAGRHIPAEVIDNLELLLSDYLDETRTKVPKEQVKDYFDFDVDIEVCTQMPNASKLKEYKKEYTKKDRRKRQMRESKAVDAADTKEEKIEEEPNIPEGSIENAYEEMNVISYVRDDDGGFTKKADVSKTKPAKRKRGKAKERKTIDELDTKYSEDGNEIDAKYSVDGTHIALTGLDAFGSDAAFIENKSNEFVVDDAVKNEVIEGCNENEVIEGLNENEDGETKPVRLEIDAQELTEKYEVVELDGVQYVNIDDVLYKIEYS